MSSRISRKPINLPQDVNVNVEGKTVSVSGPKGTLTLNCHEQVEISIENKAVNIKEKEGWSNLAGLSRSLIYNMVKGVSEGWNRVLELNGTGYRATTDGKELNLALGFSHPVKISHQSGISYEVKENKIVIKGADKELVGRTAANIRKLKPADVYKHKGFKYEGEVLIKKAGKAAKAGGTGAK